MGALSLNCSLPGLALSARGKDLELYAALPFSLNLRRTLQALPLQAATPAISLAISLAPITILFLIRLSDHEFLTSDGEILTSDGEALWG